MTSSKPVFGAHAARVVQLNREHRALAVLIVLGLAGFCFFQFSNKTLFPSASINLKYTRSEILDKAEKFAAKMGYKRTKPIKSIDFGADDTAKIFLERQFGQAKANKLMQTELPIWYWSTSFQKELDKEKASVWLSPIGDLVKFDHDLKNDHALPSMTKKDAKKMAEEFVSQQGKISLASWKLLEYQNETQIGRLDHTFCWEETDRNYKNAQRRVSVTICGNLIGYYKVFLHTPEAWQREYDTMRSYNRLFDVPARLGLSILGAAALFVFGQGLIKRDIAWLPAAVGAALFSVANFLMNCNDWTHLGAWYYPNQPYQAFVWLEFLHALRQLLTDAVAGLILCGAAERLYRQMYPDKLACDRLFTLKALTSKEVLFGLLAGLAFCGVSQGYQCLYYLLGERVGYWSPLGVDKYEILGALVPWLDASCIGLIAAIMEECLCRVVGLALLTRLTKNFWLANLIQAVIWGFAHSFYPQQPAYARGIELTIAGLASGWLIRRFGILPCIVYHYMFDAYYTVLPLQSAPLSLALTMLIPIVPPFLLTGVMAFMIKHRGFADCADSVNSAWAPNEKPVASAAVPAEQNIVKSFTYNGQAPKTRLSLAFASLALALACLAIPPQEIGYDSAKLSTRRQDAVTAASQYLKEHGVNVSGYLTRADLFSGLDRGPMTQAYFLEAEGPDRARQIFEEVEHPFIWEISFSKPGQADTYGAAVDESGHILSPSFSLEETTAGAKLTQQQALIVAESFINKYRHLYVPYKLEDTHRFVRKNRIDYAFTFSVPKYRVKEADLKITLGVIGDKASFMAHSWKIPDRWAWNYTKHNPAEIVASYGNQITAFVPIVLVIWLLVVLLRRGQISWKGALILAGCGMLIEIAKIVNLIPSFWNAYATTTPVSSYITQQCINKAGSLLLTGGCLSFIVAAAVSGALAVIMPNLSVRQALDLALRPQNKSLQVMQQNLWLDAVNIAMTGCLCDHLLGIARTYLDSHFGHSLSFANLPGSLDGATDLSLPLAMLLDSADSMIIVPAMLILAGAAYKLITAGSKKRTVIVWTLVVLNILLSSSHCHYWQDYLLSLVFGVLTCTMVWFLVIKPSLRNILVFPCSIWIGLAAKVALAYHHGAPIMGTDIVILSVLVAAPVAYVLMVTTMRTGSPSSVPVPVTVPVTSD